MKGSTRLQDFGAFSPRGLAGIDPTVHLVRSSGISGAWSGLSYLVFWSRRPRGDSRVDCRRNSDDTGGGLVVAADVRARSRGGGRGVCAALSGPHVAYFADGPDRCLVSLVLARRIGPWASDFSSGPICSEQSCLGLAVGFRSYLNIMVGFGMPLLRSLGGLAVSNRREWQRADGCRHLGLGSFGGDRGGGCLLAVV